MKTKYMLTNENGEGEPKRRCPHCTSKVKHTIWCSEYSVQNYDWWRCVCGWEETIPRRF
jgi:hypothetical protein